MLEFTPLRFRTICWLWLPLKWSKINLPWLSSIRLSIFSELITKEEVSFQRDNRCSTKCCPSWLNWLISSTLLFWLQIRSWPTQEPPWVSLETPNSQLEDTFWDMLRQPDFTSEKVRETREFARSMTVLFSLKARLSLPFPNRESSMLSN